MSVRNEPTVPPLFAACGGIRFQGYSNKIFTICAGVYGNGAGALVIMAPDGQMECKFTVNLGEYAPAPLVVCEFWSKRHEVHEIEHWLRATPFFDRTKEQVEGPWAHVYADKWVFRRCSHFSVKRAKTGSIFPYAVQCPTCRRKHDEGIEAVITKVTAIDSIDRLKGAKL